jgi:hypothetical protein
MPPELAERLQRTLAAVKLAEERLRRALAARAALEPVCHMWANDADPDPLDQHEHRSFTGDEGLARKGGGFGPGGVDTQAAADAVRQRSES